MFSIHIASLLKSKETYALLWSWHTHDTLTRTVRVFKKFKSYLNFRYRQYQIDYLIYVLLCVEEAIGCMVEGVGCIGGTMTVILSRMRYESFKRCMRPRIQVSAGM